MPPKTFTLIDDDRELALTATTLGERVEIEPASLRKSLGWNVQANGLCRDGICIPLGDSTRLVGANGVDIAELAALLDRPLALDIERGVACLGARADDRAESLASLAAPNFTLPDVDGVPHSLSDYRGRKVLLVAYASW